MNQTEVFDDLSCRFIINSPYEEFASFERMLFQIEQAHWFYEDFYRKKFSLPKYSMERFVELMFHHCPSLQPYASSVKTIYKDFKTYKSKVPVCGCILFNSDLTKVVMVQAYGSNTWGFPRGKINKDEQPSACALREVYEETGYDASANLLLEDYIDFTNRQQSVRLYLCPDVALDTVFETRTRKEIKKIAWTNVSQLPTSFEANKEPGKKMFNVPPALVSQIRSWIKRRKGKGSKGAKKGVKGGKKKRGGARKVLQRSEDGDAAEEEEEEEQQAKGEDEDASFPTDRQISKAQLRERELQRWKASSEEEGEGSSKELVLQGTPGTWNQWQVNRDKFGVVSTYNAEDYTTKLDESKAAYADRLLQAYGIKQRQRDVKQTEYLAAVAATDSNPPTKPQRPNDALHNRNKTGSSKSKSTSNTKSNKIDNSNNGGSFQIDLSSALAAFDGE